LEEHPLEATTTTSTTVPPVRDAATVVLVGATSGIGRAAAVRLARRGDRVIAVGRDATRGRDLLRDIAEHTPGEGTHTFVAGDVSTAAGVARVAEAVRERTSVVDVLVNAAGLVSRRRQVTSEGLELNFAVHHLAPYSMTGALLPLLEAGSRRIVNVNSEGHRTAISGGAVFLDYSDLQLERAYEKWTAYSRSKLANMLFTAELHRRFPHLGVVALHPGVVRTRIARDLPRAQVAMLSLFAIPPAKGADPVVHLATSPDVVNGAYYNRFDRTPASAAARDLDAAARLWRVTEQLRGPFGG
jgi:NAD(P)-dependent dehydrogenase (short-subunit alcohol dehydrogenase family)